MYIKKVDGPRAVNLDGWNSSDTGRSAAQDTRRWVASRKALVVQAVAAGLISRTGALERYALSRKSSTSGRKRSNPTGSMR